jgi:predicted Zn-dependent peptidase
MEKSIMGLTNALPSAELLCQKNSFEEYNLDNGCMLFCTMILLSRCNNSVMYHVGSKDENPEKTGFAHFSNIYYLKELKT